VGLVNAQVLEQLKNAFLDRAVALVMLLLLVPDTSWKAACWSGLSPFSHVSLPNDA
jgi:hypothetical protein